MGNKPSRLPRDVLKHGIAPYIDPCHQTTNEGENCNRSMTYVNKQGNILDCGEFCSKHCDKWVYKIVNNVPTGLAVTLYVDEPDKEYQTPLSNANIEIIDNKRIIFSVSTNLLKKSWNNDRVWYYNGKKLSSKHVFERICNILNSKKDTMELHISFTFETIKVPMLVTFVDKDNNDMKYIKPMKYWKQSTNEMEQYTNGTDRVLSLVIYWGKQPVIDKSILCGVLTTELKQTLKQRLEPYIEEGIEKERLLSTMKIMLETRFSNFSLSRCPKEKSKVDEFIIGVYESMRKDAGLSINDQIEDIVPTAATTVPAASRSFMDRPVKPTWDEYKKNKRK
jgi:hypothetical protein